MQLKQYLELNENKKIFVQRKDLPIWVINKLKEHSFAKDIEVRVGEVADVAPVVHDANVKTVYLYDNNKIKEYSLIGGQAINDNDRDFKLKKGYKHNLTKNQMILVINSFPKSAFLYVHPQSMNPILPSNEDNLSNEELMFLAITKGLKSFARKQEAQDYGLEYDSLKIEMIRKGYLNKNGSINTKGKNALLSAGIDSSYNYAAQKLGIKHRRFG